MAIFPIIETDDVQQVDDKFRISATKSYADKGEADITLVEIDPGDGTFRDVTSTGTRRHENWWLDFQHGVAGDVTVQVRVTTDGAPVVATKTVTIKTAAEERLFANDQDLVAIESDIQKYVPEGRNSFIYVHREAQSELLEWLYTNGYTKADFSRFDADDIINLSEVNFWAKYMALRMIYEDMSRQTGDFFQNKAQEYENDEHKWRQKSVFKIDRNSDAVQGEAEGFDMTVRKLVRQ